MNSGPALILAATALFGLALAYGNPRVAWQLSHDLPRAVHAALDNAVGAATAGPLAETRPLRP